MFDNGVRAFDAFTRFVRECNVLAARGDVGDLLNGQRLTVEQHSISDCQLPIANWRSSTTVVNGLVQTNP